MLAQEYLQIVNETKMLVQSSSPDEREAIMVERKAIIDTWQDQHLAIEALNEDGELDLDCKLFDDGSCVVLEVTKDHKTARLHQVADDYNKTVFKTIFVMFGGEYRIREGSPYEPI